MTVLIIGGSGFLGAEMVRQAVSAGGRPAATFHSRPGNHAGAAWHHLDLRDPFRTEEAGDEVCRDGTGVADVLAQVPGVEGLVIRGQRICQDLSAQLFPQ